MSRLLAIETSSEVCSIALSVDGELREENFHEPRRHAELLLPTIADLLVDAGVELRTLDAIAFGRGPGSFTSLRIGIGVVQGLAWGAELGVVPVSSLAALAQGVVRQTKVAEGTSIITAMDARMGEVFHARYQLCSDGRVLAESAERVEPPEMVVLPADGHYLAVGNGFERYPELGGKLEESTGAYPDSYPSAADVITLAKAWLQDNTALPAHQAQPLYIRDDVAKKPSQT